MSDRCPCGQCEMEAAPSSPLDIPVGETEEMAQVRRIITNTRAEQRRAQEEACSWRTRIHRAEKDVVALRRVYLALGQVPTPTRCPGCLITGEPHTDSTCLLACEGDHDHPITVGPYGPGRGPCTVCGAEYDEGDGAPCCRAVVTSGDPSQHEPGCYNERGR